MSSSHVFVEVTVIKSGECFFGAGAAGVVEHFDDGEIGGRGGDGFDGEGGFSEGAPNSVVEAAGVHGGGAVEGDGKVGVVGLFGEELEVEDHVAVAWVVVKLDCNDVGSFDEEGGVEGVGVEVAFVAIACV